MKLITRATYYYVLIAVAVCLLCGISFYYYISALWDEEINEQMQIDKAAILRYVKDVKELPYASPYTQNVLRYAHYDPAAAGDTLKDTLLLSPLKDEFLPYRQLRFPVMAADSMYQVSLYRPLIEKDDLLQTIAKSLFVFLVSLAFLLAVFHQWVSRKMWNPFYETLARLRQTNIQDPKTPAWPATNITEFVELQSACERMLDTIRHQFHNLNEFTGYASHEIQTSLAIIRSKLELIMQNQNLSEKDWHWLSETFAATDRLSRLTKALLVLSRVDNHQFPAKEIIDWEALLRSEVQSLAEWKDHQDLKVDISIAPCHDVRMDPSLADILVHNVLTNAYKHNVPHGHVRINLSGNMLRVANTGLPLTAETTSLFKPYITGSGSSGSTGLGLAVVDRICRYYNLRVTYLYESGWHTVSIYFGEDRISPDLEHNVV